MNFDYKNRSNRHAFHDIGLAVGDLLVQATSMGLFVHQMGGFSVEKSIADLSIPDGFEPVAMMTIGYQGDPEYLSPDLKERELAERVRRPLNVMILEGYWGKSIKTLYL